MRIYKLEAWSRNRVKVFYDEDRPVFVLYKKEAEKFGLTEGAEISDGLYAQILDEILKKRAISRMLYLLDSGARTEDGVRKKLRSGFYPEEAIDAAVSYAKTKHYIDDEYYASAFASERIKSKSRLKIRQELLNRGIDPQTIEDALSGLDEEEKETLEKLIEKKYRGVLEPDESFRQKVIRSLMQKGFRYDDIRAVMKNRELNTHN